MKNIDVLIVGGGPAGLMMALELAVQNVSFRIVDKLPVRLGNTRALAMQPRTLEVLNRHGLAQDFIDHGREYENNEIFWKRKSISCIKFQEISREDSEFRSPLFISQAETERLLDVALQRHGYSVERPVTVETIEQDDQGVTVLCSNINDNTKEETRCKYVIGCDGVRSVVRSAGSISFQGSVFPQDFILAELTCKWDLPRDNFDMFMGGEGSLVVFPLKGEKVRAVASRPKSDDSGRDPTLTEFQEIFKSVVPGKFELSDPTWLTCFRYQHRFVDRYRSGRLFICGDAAHVQSPSGGQGMNTGMQDSVNLGWKLGRVIRGEKDDSFLDTYDMERRPVGEKLVQSPETKFKFITSTSPFFVHLRNLIVPLLLPLAIKWLLGNEERRVKLFGFTTQLNIRYRRSPLVGSSSGNNGPVFGGDRVPDGELDAADAKIARLHELLIGPGHHLLLFSGTGGHTVGEDVLLHTAAEFLNHNSNWVKGHCIVSSPQGEYTHVDSQEVLHKRFGFQKPGYVLVRPDGHVAYIGLLEGIKDLSSFVARE